MTKQPSKPNWAFYVILPYGLVGLILSLYNIPRVSVFDNTIMLLGYALAFCILWFVVKPTDL